MKIGDLLSKLNCETSAKIQAFIKANVFVLHHITPNCIYCAVLIAMQTCSTCFYAHWYYKLYCFLPECAISYVLWCIYSTVMRVAWTAPVKTMDTGRWTGITVRSLFIKSISSFSSFFFIVTEETALDFQVLNV